MVSPLSHGDHGENPLKKLCVLRALGGEYVFGENGEENGFDKGK